jgi:hypothetical protein
MDTDLIQGIVGLIFLVGIIRAIVHLVYVTRGKFLLYTGIIFMAVIDIIVILSNIINYYNFFLFYIIFGVSFLLYIIIYSGLIYYEEFIRGYYTINDKDRGVKSFIKNEIKALIKLFFLGIFSSIINSIIFNNFAIFHINTNYVWLYIVAGISSVIIAFVPVKVLYG